ncbi:hypothetical protein [Allorhizobium ampelinum]|uniref:hypothetical protein n=1 Tax=Allorhizobium ampelinum TaxID=3025782 RepID=UPI000B405855|nr:hypothetical protein [Allorhizobium ampelinum]NTA27418.1 hypothetical protein [Allorhizobium ampelinum]OVE94474.1 hypothetical protein B7W85_13055 [Allorhizobium ampelinum]
MRDDYGLVFPPIDEWDIVAYPIDDVVNGYLSFKNDDPDPGNNHSAGFRWGWANCKKDRIYKTSPDGFERLRALAINLERQRA